MRLKNIHGCKFGRLLVLERSLNIGSQTAYKCQCDCGQIKVIRAQSLQKGDTKSCGCSRRETMAIKQYRHGYFRSPTYNSWRAMLARCSNVRHPQFKDYGGRGIYFCDRWMQFENFLADLGERPNDKTLDRIDNNKGYEPSNCRWATRTEQNNNKRKKGINNV